MKQKSFRMASEYRSTDFLSKVQRLQLKHGEFSSYQHTFQRKSGQTNKNAVFYYQQFVEVIKHPSTEKCALSTTKTIIDVSEANRDLDSEIGE